MLRVLAISSLLVSVTSNQRPDFFRFGDDEDALYTVMVTSEGTVLAINVLVSDEPPRYEAGLVVRSSSDATEVLEFNPDTMSRWLEDETVRTAQWPGPGQGPALIQWEIDCDESGSGYCCGMRNGLTGEVCIVCNSRNQDTGDWGDQTWWCTLAK